MNFASLSKMASQGAAMAATAASKAKDLAHDAADTAARARQQALEAAGVADKTDDDDTLPELRCEPHTRRFYFSERYTSHWPVGCSAGFFFSHLFLSLCFALAGRTSASTSTCANCTSTRTATCARSTR